MERNEIIKFGIFHEDFHRHDASDITSATAINDNSYIITTTTKIYRIEGSSIHSSFPMQFSISVYVEKYQFVISVSIHAANLFIFPINEINRPLILNYSTGQRNISFLIYSPKSDSIISLGDKIQVWKMNVIKYSKMIRPTVNLVLLRTFKGAFNISPFHSIGFDTQKEIIFIPSNEGIQSYSIEGEKLQEIAKISTNMSTLFSYTNFSKEFLICDRLNGLSVWTNLGTFYKRISFGGSSITFLSFVDEENVVIFDEENCFYLLNIKTNRSMVYLTINRKPLKVFLLKMKKPSLLVSFEDHFDIYSISIPWKVFELNVIRPILTKIVPKKSYLPRFLVQTENSFCKIYSPKDGKQLTAATPSFAAFPVSVYYDRGYIIHYVKSQFGSFSPEIVLIDENREMLIMNMDNEKTVVFDALASPMKELLTISLKTKHILPCVYNNKWCYAIHEEIGEISLIEYNRFKLIDKFKLTNTKIINFFYHYPSNSLIVIFKNEIVRFSLTEKVILSRVYTDIELTFSDLFCDSVFIGEKNGKIHKFNIEEDQKITKDPNEINGHLAAVSYISFSPSFMISSSFDGAVVIWDYSFNKVSQITSPLPIYTCCFLNGQRDVVIGTETELMMICGKDIFDGVQDDEHADIDNFLKNEDAFILYNKAIEIKMNRQYNRNVNKSKPKARSLVQDRIAKLKQKVEEMNKEKEKKMMENENESENKKQLDESMKKRIYDQMIALTLQQDDEGIPTASSILNQSNSIQFQPTVPQSENTNNPRNLQKEKEIDSSRRSSSRSSIKSATSEYDEETIKSKAKLFLKKSISKDEKVTKRRIRRQKKLKEKEEKEKERIRKNLSDKPIEIPRQKTEQEILLDSMDTTLTITEIHSDEPEPEIFFMPPSRNPTPKKPISRPARKAANVPRLTPNEFKANLEKIAKENRRKGEEEEEKEMKKIKMKNKKKNLHKRLKRAPTPPEIRKATENAKEPKKKKRAKTPPMLDGPPKLVKYKKIQAVVDSNVVQEVFAHKSNNEKIVQSSRPHLVDTGTDANNDTYNEPKTAKPPIISAVKDKKDEKKEDEKKEVENEIIVVSIQPQPPPPSPPPSSPSSLQQETEIEHFEVKPPSFPNPRNEPINPPSKPKENEMPDSGFYITELGKEAKIKSSLTEANAESQTVDERRKKEFNFKEVSRLIKETEKRLYELDEERQVDPLAWRGVPPKLEKMKVKSIDVFNDDFMNENHNFYPNFNNSIKTSENRVRNRYGNGIHSSSSSSSLNSLSVKVSRISDDDKSALGFLSNWNARKAQRSSRRASNSARRSKVSRVEKNHPWM